MSRSQRWECVPCRVSIRVLFHTGDPLPEERQCSKCGNAMGLVLFATDDAPKSERPEPRRARA